jgi:hypothetical protein
MISNDSNMLFVANLLFDLFDHIILQALDLFALYFIFIFIFLFILVLYNNIFAQFFSCLKYSMKCLNSFSCFAECR